MRVEKDLLGSVEIPEEKYWGIHTQRAIKNFPFDGRRFPIDIIHALVFVKRASAMANIEGKFIDEKVGRAILFACDEILSGKYDKQFPLPSLQGGAGTSLNMNVNEVIANIAIEKLGGSKGQYEIVDPIETVNRHQSTNDTFPTAVKIAVIEKLRKLSEAIAKVQGTFQKKEKEFSDIIILSRTEMQNAIPVTLGTIFASFAEAFSRDRWRIFKSEERIRSVNIGGTAVGTGLTAPRSYIFSVIEKLREITSLPLARADLLADQTANLDSFIEVSGMLVANATNLIKVANDLRFMHYQKEIELPPCQAGSSIMPGKINPVIAEAVISAGIKVKSLDAIIKDATSLGSMQINEFLPLVADSIIQELDMLITANDIFSNHILKIVANAKLCEEHVDNSLSYITPFVPHIGYEKCEELLKEYEKSGNKMKFREFLILTLGEELVEKVLSPESLTALGYKK